MSETVHLSRKNWWDDLDDNYSNLENQIVIYLRGAIGAYFSKSNPPSITPDEYRNLIDEVDKVMIDDEAYFPIYIEGTVRLQSYIETPEDGFSRSNDVYITDDEDDDVIYLLKLKNGLIVKAKVDKEKKFTSGAIPWITCEELEDENGDDLDEEEILDTNIVGWKRYHE